MKTLSIKFQQLLIGSVADTYVTHVSSAADSTKDFNARQMYVS